VNNLSERERLDVRALKLIVEKGDEGILQRDLWRELGTNNRRGSRIALQLKQQLIIRERELANRRWTYRLFSNIQPITIDSIS
jgi:hypothetical protein